MSTISSRRYFIVVVLLIMAVAGALLRSFAVPQSTPYYLGTLLMVMWVPIVGNIISFLGKKLSPVALAKPTFSAATPFVRQAVVELRGQSEQDLDLPQKEQDGRIHGLFVVGTEGFSIRFSLLDIEVADGCLGAEVQFFSPAAARPKFPVGSAFKVMQGNSGIGTGQVLSWSPDAALSI
jgi:hypothetical protein